MKYLLSMLLMCSTKLCYSQCDCKTTSGSGFNSVVCTPKVIVENNKQFKVVLMGMSKSNNSIYSISVVQIYKGSALTITGSVSFVLQDNTIIQGKLLNSWLDNDEEMGLNCISNIVIEQSSIQSFRKSPIKYFSYMSSSGVKYQITLQSNKNVIQSQAFCF